MKYIPTIGLEIHVGLDTETKMFCACPNDPFESCPNVNVCPVCLAHPGTLPVPNGKAIESVILLGLALNGKVAKFSHFDRKSYFYPDLPKGYQISQYEYPFVSGGELKGVKITRVHLEEDTGSLVHSKKGDYSLVDYNRAGVPLMELVTEPDITSADQAVGFAKELQMILRYLGVSKADMEKGQMRIEANISLAEDKKGKGGKNQKLGTKVEVKNLNSFRAVHGAIEYEMKRQAEILEKGGKVEHETRGWDGGKMITVSQRTKEFAHDYRYFPEPDIPPIQITDKEIEKIKSTLPELPEQKRNRFQKEFFLAESQAELLVEDKSGAAFFEEAVSELKTFDSHIKDYGVLYNYFTSDLRGLMIEKKTDFESLLVKPEHLAHLAFMVLKKELSSRLAKDMLRKMFDTGKCPEAIKEEEGMAVIGDENELRKSAEEIIKKNPKAVSDYKKGNESALKFLVGQMMAKTRGQADPEASAEVFKKILK